MKITDTNVPFQNDSGVRSKRDTKTYYHNIANVDGEGDNKSALTQEIPEFLRELQPSSFIPSQNPTELADRLTCMSYALHSQGMPMDSGKHKTRHFRSVSEPDFGNLESETQIMMGKCCNVEMEAPHFVEESSTRRNRWGLFDFGGKIMKSLFGVVTNEEAEDMQHAINILAENQFKISGHL